MKIGEYIKKLREEKNFSQRQLGLYSGVSNTEISKIESGKRQNPSPEILEKIAPYLDTTYEELMSVAGYIKNDPKKEYTGEELLKYIPEEYKESFKKLDIKQLKFVKKMVDEDIDPDVLIDTMNKINEYYEKLNKKKPD